MLKAVIFDMDDTLIDWDSREMNWREYDREHLRGVFEYVTRELHPLADFEAFVRAAQTRTEMDWLEAQSSLRAPNLGRTLVETLAEMGVPGNLLEAGRCLRAYDWQGVPGARLFPEVPEVVRRLRSEGLRLGIITNAYQPMWAREHEMERLGLPPDLFDCRVSSADVGYLKPHPAVFEHALACLEAEPEQAVFIGDDPRCDIVGAQSVGMRAILRVRPEAPIGSWGLIGPDGVIRNLNELPTYLDTWFPGWRNGA